MNFSRVIDRLRKALWQGHPAHECQDEMSNEGGEMRMVRGFFRRAHDSRIDCPVRPRCVDRSPFAKSLGSDKAVQPAVCCARDAEGVEQVRGGNVGGRSDGQRRKDSWAGSPCHRDRRFAALALLLVIGFASGAWHFLLAQDRFADSPVATSDPARPTNFGSRQSEVPEDPRDAFGGQMYDFPAWDISRETPNDVFIFARLRYTSGQWGRRPKWMIDYPDCDLNISYRLQQLTSLEVSPYGAVVDIDAEQMRNYPFIYMIEPGDIYINNDEARVLREYLLNGGFIMVDDFWGSDEWATFYRAFKQIFPNREPKELDLDHPIFNIVFQLDMKPQIPAVGIAMMGRQSGITYEWNKPGTEVPQYKGVWDDKGRLCMVICFNTDLGDGWEEEGTDPWYFREFSEKYAYPLGINIIFYAMTH